MGGDGFREGLEELASHVIKDRKRESYTTEALRRHDGNEAERLLARGLKALGLSLEEVRLLKQNNPRKQALAWLVKSNSSVPDLWIQERLVMGHRTNVGRAVRLYRDPSTHKLLTYKNILLKCTD